MSTTGYIDTYYLHTLLEHQLYPRQSGTEEVDVVVVGGGLAGLNTALGLLERGKSVALVEAKRIGWGASGRNGGYVAKGYAAGIEPLIKKVGLEKAQRLMEMSKNARRLIKKRIEDFNIDCDYKGTGVLTVSLVSDVKALRRYIDDMNKKFDIGYVFWPREKVQQNCKTDKYYDGICSVHDFQFNPLKYVRGLARVITEKGGRVYENSPAEAIVKDGSGWEVSTPQGRIKAQHVVVCCSIYVGDLDKRLKNAAFPVQTYVMVTQPIKKGILKSAIDTTHAVYDMRFASDFYRVIEENRILWGGRVGMWACPNDVGKAMLEDMLKVYPQLQGHVRQGRAWSGLLCYAPHKMPQIGQIEPGYWYNTGFGGHGLAPTTVGGEVVASAIAGGSEDYKEFEKFGLSYAGGALGPYVAQLVYWWWRFMDVTKV